MLALLGEECDVVYGTPDQQQHGVLRDLASTITKLALQSAMGAETARCVSAFRVFRTQVRDAFASYKSPYVSIDVLLTWGTTRFAAATVRHDPRTIGRSGYTLGRLVRHAMNQMTGFSTFPLQAASIIGFIFTFFGVFVLAYVVGRYLLYGRTVAGFPFLASVISIFAGAQLFALGIIGEYLARMHFRTMDRPPYTIRSAILRAKSTAMNSNLCQHLPWDSSFFGRKIARVQPTTVNKNRIEEALHWSATERVDCLYFLCDTADPASASLAESHGFNMMDVKVTKEFSIASVTDRSNFSGTADVRRAISRDVPTLKTIAKVSHRDSRFYADQHSTGFVALRFTKPGSKRVATDGPTSFLLRVLMRRRSAIFHAIKISQDWGI